MFNDQLFQRAENLLRAFISGVEVHLDPIDDSELIACLNSEEFYTRIQSSNAFPSHEKPTVQLRMKKCPSCGKTTPRGCLVTKP